MTIIPTMRSMMRLIEDASFSNADAPSLVKPSSRKKPLNKLLVDQPAFKRWFKGSKVVDAKGKPLKVYHGSPSAFAAFDNNSEDSSNTHGMIFFATEPKFASGYASTNGYEKATPNVMPCYLRVLKLFDFRKHSYLAQRFFDETGGVQDEFEAEKIRIALYGREDVDDHDNPEIHSEDMDADEFEEALKRGCYPALESDQFVNWLRGHGVDGMVILEDGSINFAVFSSKQVKSAVSNVGTFDPDNDTITESE